MMTDTKVRTLAQLAQEAIDVQNACNLSGVAQGFARAMIELGTYTNGTTERNQHPIAKLWADKISDLSRSRETSDVMDAYAAVETLIGADVV